MRTQALWLPRIWLLQGEREAKIHRVSGAHNGGRGCIHAAACGLQNQGKRIPEDISVVGFDNVELSAIAAPPASSSTVFSGGRANRTPLLPQAMTDSGDRADGLKAVSEFNGVYPFDTILSCLPYQL